MHNHSVRIIGMLNIAFAASNMPNNIVEGKVEEYLHIINFIQSQYKAITGKELMLPESIRGVLEVIRVIKLPKPKKMNLDEVDRLNKLAIQILRAA